MRLVFFGSGAFGMPTLSELVARHEVSLIVTQPDRKAGRGGKRTPTPIGAWAAEYCPRVPVLKPERVNEPEIRQSIRDLSADAWVVIAFGQKLGPKLLEDVFAINLHASLLPRWRGAAPIHHAVMAGDSQTGNSVITLADEMDAGDVLGTSTRAIPGDTTTGDLHDLLAADGPSLVLDVLDRYHRDETNATAQDVSAVTLAPKLSRDDAALDLNDDADVIRAQINGLSPWPGCSVEIDGTRIKLLRCETVDASEHTAHKPGTLVDAAAGVLACGNGSVRLIEVQPAGGRAMPFGDFARGRSIQHGTVATQPHRPQRDATR